MLLLLNYRLNDRGDRNDRVENRRDSRDSARDTGAPRDSRYNRDADSGLERKVERYDRRDDRDNTRSVDNRQERVVNSRTFENSNRRDNVREFRETPRDTQSRGTADRFDRLVYKVVLPNIWRTFDKLLMPFLVCIIAKM